MEHVSLLVEYGVVEDVSSDGVVHTSAIAESVAIEHVLLFVEFGLVKDVLPFINLGVVKHISAFVKFVAVEHVLQSVGIPTFPFSLSTSLNM